MVHCQCGDFPGLKRVSVRDQSVPTRFMWANTLRNINSNAPRVPVLINGAFLGRVMVNGH